MKFKVIPGQITFGEQMDLEEGQAKALHDILVRFAYDDDGHKVSAEDASAHIRSWTLDELTAKQDELKDALSGDSLSPQPASA